MTMPVVWSERNELHDPTGSEHDCYVAAPLMCLVYGGKLSYPLGIYTALEREALERSDGRPDEEGGTPSDADEAIQKRYGLSMHIPTEASLGEVTIVGRALSVGGRLANFPVGHRLRRYAPAYLGGHRICYIPISRLSGTWLDPLAPWLYAGEQVTLAEVGLFAKGRAASDLRYTLKDEYIQGEAMTLYVQTAEAGSFTVPTSAKVYDKGASGFVATGSTLPAGSAGKYDAKLGGNGAPSSLIHVSSGNGVTHYLSTAEVDEKPDPVQGATLLAPGIYEVKP